MAVSFNALALAPCIAAFGEAATYCPGAGAPIALTGIFNRFARDEKINAETGELRQVIQPSFAFNAADLPAGLPLPGNGEQIAVDGNVWAISETVPDSFGHVLLKLKRLT